MRGEVSERLVRVLTSETKREGDSTEQLPHAWRLHTNTIGYPAYGPAHSERMRGRPGGSSGRWDRDGTRGRETRLTERKQTDNKPSQKQSKRIQRGKREAEGKSKHTSRASDGDRAGGPSGRCTRRSERARRPARRRRGSLGRVGHVRKGSAGPGTVQANGMTVDLLRGGPTAANATLRCTRVSLVARKSPRQCCLPTCSALGLLCPNIVRSQLCMWLCWCEPPRAPVQTRIARRGSMRALRHVRTKSDPLAWSGRREPVQR